jgi:hypothetical protein
MEEKYEIWLENLKEGYHLGDVIYGWEGNVKISLKDISSCFPHFIHE